VVANLGIISFVAALSILIEIIWPATHDTIDGIQRSTTCAFALAALAEATADTVSSEIGQAIGGRTWMLTTLKRVAPGMDGGISLWGTLAGLIGAAMVVVVGAFSMHLSARIAGFAMAGAAFGLFFDSLLGAMLERRGWINNDVVNFSSTLAAALMAGLMAVR
jgi:uncharacterized protein (TIGR00297 family)